MLDRSTPPPIKEVETLTFPEVDSCCLPNGIPLYIIDRGDQELSRVDILFSAGKVQERQPLTAKFTAAMLREGASGLSSAYIAEKLDYYGAILQTLATQRNTYITLYSANRYFFDILPLLCKLVVSPDFPEEEFRTLKERNRQALSVDLMKVNVLASRIFSEQLFGAENPYGKSEQLADYDTLTTAHLREFHSRYYTAEQCRIVLSGRITPEMKAAVKETFAAVPSRSESERFLFPAIHSSNEHYRFVEKAGALQAGIRVGRLVVGRDHPDHHILRVLNTVLGGYFGSRLMSNIREEKGYTYGIQSSVVTYPDVSYLVVQTQAATSYVKPLIDEIFNEFSRLRNELVEPDELRMVRNYMTGEMLRLFDSPFSVAEVFVTLLANGLDFSYYNERFGVIRSFTAEQLQAAARCYLNKENFYVVVAGQEK